MKRKKAVSTEKRDQVDDVSPAARMAPLPASGDATRAVKAVCVFESCGRTFTYDPANLEATSFPFCSPRCKGADLGNWVSEGYRVPGLPDLRGLDDEDDEKTFTPKDDEED